MHIEHLYVSPGHNYFGRHGGLAGAHPILEVKEIECVAGRGIRGDRFFDYPENHKGQITFFCMEVLEDLQTKLALPNALPSDPRRNVLVRGVDLPSLIGQEFEIQGVRFLGTEECSPCYWMDHALKPGAKDLLKGRGGLRARILTSGRLRISS
jgi:MOSC domain-containing protein YiiM